MSNDGLSDGYLERMSGGTYEGSVFVEKRIDLSPIEGVYFKKDGETYLWLRRKPALEYDFETQSYRKRERTPKWECYLKKQLDGDTVAFKGEFMFMRFRYSIYGVWDSVLGNDKKRLLNLYVERMPMSEQTIINNINERKRNEDGRRDKS